MNDFKDELRLTPPPQVAKGSKIGARFIATVLAAELIRKSGVVPTENADEALRIARRAVEMAKHIEENT